MPKKAAPKKNTYTANIVCTDKGCAKPGCSGACGGALYFIGFIGAAVYYISTATGFWMGVLGFLKALVWPAFLVYKLLVFLGA